MLNDKVVVLSAKESVSLYSQMIQRTMKLEKEIQVAAEEGDSQRVFHVAEQIQTARAIAEKVNPWEEIARQEEARALVSK